MSKGYFSTATLAQVATILAQEYGVRVQLGGNKACCMRNPKTNKFVIHLPNLSTTAPTYMDIMRCYLDHEAGHVRFSDMRLMEKHMDRGNYILRSVWNTFEDVYVERRMSKSFPGCARNLRLGAERLFGDKTESIDDPVLVLLNYILFKSRYQATKSKCFEDRMNEMIPFLSPELKAICDSYIAQLPKCKSTRDNMQLAQLFVDDLLKYIEDNMQSDNTGDGDGSGDGSCQGDGDSDPGDDTDDDDDSFGSGSGSSGDGSDSSEDGEAGGSGGQSDDDIGDIPDMSASDGVPNEEAGFGKGGGAAGGVNDMDKMDAMLESLMAALGEQQHDIDDERESYDLEDRVNKALAKQMDKDDSNMYDLFGSSDTRDRVYTSIKDIDNKHLREAFRPLSGEDMRDALKESAKLSSQLTGLLQTMTMNRGGAARKGRLDSKRLARIAVGRTDIFSTRIEKRGLDTEVILVVDMSGSMDGYDWSDRSGNRRTKMAVANAALFSIMRTLKTIPGVRSMAFTYGAYTVHINNFNDSFTDRTPLCHNSAGGTPTGDALQHTLTLFSPSAKRRIVMLLTDGEPDSNEYFRMTLSLLKRQGIEVLGVGILDDSIRDDMDESECCIIKSLDELSPNLFRLLREKLVRIA